MKFLDEKEVAKKIKVSRSMLNFQRKNGLIPFTTIKGRIKYKLSDLEKYKNNYHKYKFSIYKEKNPNYVSPPSNWRYKTQGKTL